METLQPLSLCSAGNAGARLVCCEDSSLLYATGNGLVVHNTETGAQRHIWNQSDVLHNSSGGCTLFARCAETQELLFVEHSPQESCIVFASVANLTQTGVIKGPARQEWQHLACSRDGKRVLTVGSFPDYVLDVWERSNSLNQIKVPLGDRLSSLGAEFFPLNPNVVCACGSTAARLLYFEPVLNTYIVRQANVELNVLSEDEHLSAFRWTPNGSVLLGTTLGRLLVVKSAAPPAVPSEDWGSQPLEAGVLYEAEEAGLAGPMVAIFVTQLHIIMVLGGAGDQPPGIIWRDAKAGSAKEAVACTLPLRKVVAADLSPSFNRIGLLTADGGMHLADSVYSLPRPLEVTARRRRDDYQRSTSGSGGPDATSLQQPRVGCRPLAQHHRGRVNALLALPGKMAATAGEDGIVHFWRFSYQLGPEASTASSSGGARAGPGSAAGAAPAGGSQLVSVELAGRWHVAEPVTCMVAYQATPVFLLGTSSGALQLLNTERICPSREAGELMGPVDPLTGCSWDLRPFKGPITGMAFSIEGEYCAVSCASEGRLAFFHVLTSGTDVALQLLGFYQIKMPGALAFGPPGPDDGTKPNLVVSTTNGELQVLKVPLSAETHRSEEALIPPGSLAKASMRSASIITALMAAPAPATDHPGDGHFWVLAAGMDKSIRRFRMCSNQQKQNTVTAATSTRSLMSAQNFQVPETERNGELAMPATRMALMPSGKHLMVACQDGAVAVYSFPDLHLQGRLPLHSMLAGGSVGAVMLSDSLMVSAGADGVVQGVEIALGLPMQQRAAARAVTKPSAGGKAGRPGPLSAAASGFAVPAHRLALLVEAHTDIGQVLGWKEARLQTARSQKSGSIQAFTEALHDKRDAWLKLLEQLRKQNQDAEPNEQLADSEFIINRGHAADLRQEVDSRVARVKTRLMRELQGQDMLVDRLKRLFWNSSEVRQAVLLALPEYPFLSNIDQNDLKRWKDTGAGVKVGQVLNYAMRNLPPSEQRRLAKVKFLRRVEQEEMRGRAAEQRGQVAVIRRYKGSMQRFTGSLLGLELDGGSEDGERGHEGQTPASPAPGGALLPAKPPGNPASPTSPGAPDDPLDDDDEDDLLAKRQAAAAQEEVEGVEVENGACGLLYHQMQLHCRGRKVTQALLVQEEVRTLQALFNARFSEVAGDKAKDVDRIEEKLTRVAEIQAELKGPPPSSSLHSMAAEEAMEHVLDVKDSEVPVEKYVSPEEKARLDAERAAAEEARRRAEADDARQRALREMMNGTPETRKTAAQATGPQREPWMDLPRHQLTAEQRKALTEWEKAAAEAEEEAERQRRQLEAERKALEMEVADIVLAFNTKLTHLANSKTKMDVEILNLEHYAASAALEVVGEGQARQLAASLDSHLAQLQERKARRQGLLYEMRKAAEKATSEYEALHLQERQMDKAFKREFGNREDLFDEVHKIYRDRRHKLSGAPIRSAADLLGKVPEGQAMMPPPSPSPSPPPPRAEFSENGGPALPDMLLQPPRLLSRSLSRVADVITEPGTALGVYQRRRGLGRQPSQRLRQLVENGGRGLDPLLEAYCEGRPVTELAADMTPLGLGMADTAASSSSPSSSAPGQHHTSHHTSTASSSSAGGAAPQGRSLDPFLSKSLKKVFMPGATRDESEGGEGGEVPEGHGAGAGAHHPLPKEEQLSRPPYDQNDKPEGLEDVWWVRLMEYRDTRLVLEQQSSAAWHRAVALTAQLDSVEREDAEIDSQLDSVVGRQGDMADQARRTAVDLLLSYRLNNGQVELAEGGGQLPGPLLAEATFAHRFDVEKLNLNILDRGGWKVDMLRELKELQQSIHLAEWEVRAGELRIRHAADALKEFQLLHVTKELQAALRDPANAGKQDSEARMAVLLEGAATSHAQRVTLRSRMLDRVTDRVAGGIEVHEELTLAEKEAEAILKDSQHVHTIVEKHKEVEEGSMRRHLKNIVTNNQLKEIAKQQAQEIFALQQQLLGLQQRTFPALAPPSSSGWAPPDSRGGAGSAARSRGVTPALTSRSRGVFRGSSRGGV